MIPRWKINPMIKDGELLFSSLCITDKRRCVLRSVSASPHTLSLLSALTLSCRPGRYKEGRGAETEHWRVGRSRQQNRHTKGQQHGKKGSFPSWYPDVLSWYLTCCHQRQTCVFVCRESATSALNYFCWGSVDGLWLSLQPHKVGFNAG